MRKTPFNQTNETFLTSALRLAQSMARGTEEADDILQNAIASALGKLAAFAGRSNRV